MTVRHSSTLWSDSAHVVLFNSGGIMHVDAVAHDKGICAVG